MARMRTVHIAGKPTKYFLSIETGRGQKSLIFVIGLFTQSFQFLVSKSAIQLIGNVGGKCAFAAQSR